MLDVAVIGAGHNGLIAAAYLARAGLAVEVCERRDVAGGACVTEELWPGVRASPGAYTLSLLRPEIVRELDLARTGSTWSVHEPYLFAPFPGRAQGGHVVEPRAHHVRGSSATGRRADADGYARVRRPLGAARPSAPAR